METCKTSTEEGHSKWKNSQWDLGGMACVSWVPPVRAAGAARSAKPRPYCLKMTSERANTRARCARPRRVEVDAPLAVALGRSAEIVHRDRVTRGAQ